MIRFTIPGPAVPKGRPRVTRTGHAYTPQRTKAYAEKVQWIAKAFAPKTPLSGPVSVRIVEYRKGTPDARPDIDNALKNLLDAMNGLIWQDDSQVVRLFAEKRYDPKSPRVEVEVEEVEPA